MKKILLVFCVVLLAACGGSDDSEGADAESSETPTDAVQSDASADAPATTEASTDRPAATAGALGMALTIGDETWEFPSALCAYENAPAGEDGSEWNVSMVQDGLQIYITEDSYGSAVSITDIENYGDLEWVAEGGAVTLTVDGNTITAEGTFSDLADGLPDREGTLSATCASWHAG